MTRTQIDVLMVTYRSPERTRISLGRLLDAADASTRVWLWHNGDHEPTLEVVRSFLRHPNVENFHHSAENVRLGPPTKWLFDEGTAPYLSKIDDDAVVPYGWPAPLIAAHEDEPRFGVLGSWRFMDEDFHEELASRKIQEFSNGHRIMRNLWVEGSTFVMKRACVSDIGSIRPGQSFTWYCRELGRRGWINGYYFPFVRYGNLDDPRSPDTLIRSDSDLVERVPLSAHRNGVETVEQWTNQIRQSALTVQTTSFDPRHYFGWRFQVRRAQRLARRFGATGGGPRTS